MSRLPCPGGGVPGEEPEVAGSLLRAPSSSSRAGGMAPTFVLWFLLGFSHALSSGTPKRTPPQGAGVSSQLCAWQPVDGGHLLPAVKANPNYSGAGDAAHWRPRSRPALCYRLAPNTLGENRNKNKLIAPDPIQES